MTAQRKIKNLINQVLALFCFEIQSKKKENDELLRLGGLKRNHFGKPVFALPQGFKASNPIPILKKIKQQEDLWKKISSSDGNDFNLKNDYFTSPDAEVLTALVELFKPRQIVEIGSGNSTRLFRLASEEFQTNSKIISIDPFPRVEIENYAHSILKKRVEDIEKEWFYKKIRPGDFLFIDSSHEIKTGNDVVELFLNILPRLKPGVLIHIHDIFLPYEYPREWIMQNRRPWNEQYLVQALLQGSEEYEVLWAGHYHQKTMPDFAKHFPFWQGKDASSLWLRKIRSNS